MKTLYLITILILLITSCQNKAPKGNPDFVIHKSRYTDTFAVHMWISSNDAFYTYNEFDKQMDSVFRTFPVLGEGGFKANRSRIFMQTITNGVPAQQDSALYKGMPTPVYSELKNDTINLKMGIGFFGGMGFEIKIFRNHFQSSYFLYTDDVKPYKVNSDDTFTNSINVNNNFQSLTLNEAPSYIKGQQLTGYLTFTSRNFYERSIADKVDTTFVKGELYFTCQIK